MRPEKRRLLRDMSTAAGSRLLVAGTVVDAYPVRVDFQELVDLAVPKDHGGPMAGEYWLTIPARQLDEYTEAT